MLEVKITQEKICLDGEGLYMHVHSRVEVQGRCCESIGIANTFIFSPECLARDIQAG